MNKKTLISLSIILALVLVVVSLVYWFTPSGSLPKYMPGYEIGGTNIHFKHGLASLILALGLFVYAWFKSGPKK